MHPRSGFRYQGTSECTLVPVFGTGEHPPKPPFGNHPFANPRKCNDLEKNSVIRELVAHLIS